MLKASTDALSALAQATSERTTVTFFNSSEMRDTPEAVAFRRAHARKLMAAAALALSPPDTSSGASPPPASTGNAPAAGQCKPSTPALTSTSTPRIPPAQEQAAGTAVVPASTPEASAPGGAPPASAVKTTTATVSSPAASAAGSCAASRGRRSLPTKQDKAAEALPAGSKTLDYVNDGIYVVLVFPVRDDGADCTEDRKDAEGENSSDDDSNAEYR